MKLFTLQFQHFDFSFDLLLVHNNKTDEEFNNDIKVLMKEYSKQVLKENKEEIIQTQDFIHFVFDKLKEEKGYSEPEKVIFKLEGSANVDLGVEGVDNEHGLKKVLPKKQYEKIVKKNRELYELWEREDEELYKQREKENYVTKEVLDKILTKSKKFLESKLDLNILEKKLDDALEKETSESLTEWLETERKNKNG